MSENGNGNGLNGEWDRVSRSDLRMLEKAVSRRWPIDPDLKALLIQRAREALEAGELTVRELGVLGRLVMSGEDQNQADENVGKSDTTVHVVITRETRDAVG